ncbi:MAG: prolyl oligopeptidase family serine peptidase [Myxococcales bacterium]|nr:prolyl oligopeptidase family serine peptidase [Myxococcales bacterium]
MPRFPFLALASSVVLAFAACGGDDDPGGSSGGSSGSSGASSGGSSGASSGSSGASSGSSGQDAAPEVRRSAGCGKSAAASPATGDAKSVTVGGKKRTFLEFVPAGYDRDRAYPVVLTVHGIGATGKDMAEYIEMQTYVAGGAIVEFPDGEGGQWDLSGAKDLDFFDALVDDAAARLCVDPKRVFVLGFSLGAYMTNHAGCQRPARYRGIAAADGGFPDKGACAGKTAALVYHRTEDDDERIANGRAARDKWVANNGCASTTKPYGDAKLGCVAYDGCPGASPVVWCEDTATSPYKHDLREPYRVPIWKWMEALP